MRWAIALILLAACGPTSEHPLGGRYGGSARPPAPSSGSPYGTGGNVGEGPSAPDPGPGAGRASPGGGDIDEPPAGSSTITDAGVTDDSQVAPGGSDAATGVPVGPPTWSQLHTRYFAIGTIGDCPSCHAEMSDPHGAYGWLQQQHELTALDDPNASVLSWYGGGMPKHGPAHAAQATADIHAWAAAGRLDN